MDLGFESTNCVQNMGSTFFYIILNIGVMVAFKLLAAISKYSNKYFLIVCNTFRLIKARDFFENRLFWNFFLRFFI
jgi:hypothetical protein